MASEYYTETKYSDQKNNKLTTHSNNKKALSKENSTDFSGINTSDSATLAPSSNAWSPSVQTLLDKPPASFPLRFITASLVFAIVLAAWAWFGKIEEVGKAQGKLVPKDSTYQVDPTKNGKINQLFIEEGDQVSKGETLATLNAEKVKQKIDQLESELDNYKDQLQQKKNLLKITKLEASNKQKIANSKIKTQKIAIAKVNETISLKKGQLKTLESELSKHQKRVQRLKPLQKKGAISQEYVFQAQQSLQDTKMKVNRLKNEIDTAQKEIKRLQNKLTQTKKQNNQTLLKSQTKIKQVQLDIEQLKAKIKDTKHQLAAARNEQTKTRLKSPVNGTILSLNLQNIGQVIKPGQTIAEIAPKQSPLVLDASVPAKEAGLLEKDMPVKIKFDAYPYQDYGLVKGRVTSISPNSYTNKKGTFYKVQISLNRNYITHNNKKIKFQAGQPANAEIVIRSRRIADIIFDPIQKLKEDSLSL